MLPTQKRIRGRNTALALTSFVSFALAAVCHAQVSTITSVSGQYESNSNVYELSRGTPVPGTLDYSHADNIYSGTGNFQGNYQASQQLFYTQLTGSEDRYDHFTQLNHSEYKIDGGWNWRFDQNLYGTLEVDRSRSTSPFIDVIDSSYAYLTEQKEIAAIGYQFGANWRLEASGYHSTDDTPFEDAPDLRLTQSSGTTAIKYVGNAGLTAGLSVGYVNAAFNGGGDLADENENSSYEQTTVDLVANYKATGRSIFAGTIGYSRQNSDSKFNSYSGGTGHIEYKYDITPKTSFEIALNRLITSSIANVGVGTAYQTPGARITGSEVDSSGTISLAWQPIRKVNVGAAYTYTYSKFPDQGYVIGTDQTNRLQFATLRVEYRPILWLVLTPYAKWTTRSSTFVDGGFNQNQIGIYVTAELRRGKPPANQPAGGNQGVQPGGN